MKRTSLEWSDLEIAKENLQRIKIHYDFYQNEEGRGAYYKESKGKTKLPNCCKIDKQYGSIYLVLKKDDGSDFAFYPVWCGYFEHLYRAQIVSDEMRIDI